MSRTKKFASVMTLLSQLTQEEALGVLTPNSYDIYSGVSADLAYDTETGAFTVGLTVTGGTSSATGVIGAITDNGSTGILHLNDIAGGTFQDDEALTDTDTGAAVANGVISPHEGNWCKVSIVEAAVFLDNGVFVGSAAIPNHGTHTFPAGMEWIADFTKLQLVSGVILAHKIT